MQDVVAELRVGIKDLAAERRAGWTAVSRSDRVRDLVGLSEAIQVELVRGLASWDRTTAWADDGAVTAVAWLKANAGLTGPEASGLVRLARLYDQHRCVADALDGGDLTLAKARLLARAEKNHQGLFAECVTGLVHLAQKLGNQDFAQVIDQWIELVDDRPPPDDSKRSWKSADTIGGSAHTNMFGSADDAALMRAAIEALDTPDPADCPEGPRCREQRHYDIVLDIFRRALADQLGDDVASPTSADIVMDAETAAHLVADPDKGQYDLENPILDLLQPFNENDTAGDRFFNRYCQHPDGTPARRALAAATLCNGWVRRIIRDPKTGNVLDVGRAHRRFTPRQRRALTVRDGGCVFPGCDRKPKWCDAHHLKFWDDDGPTDLDNGALVCRRHHTLIHHRDWRLRRDPTTGIITATAPGGREFTRRPNQTR